MLVEVELYRLLRRLGRRDGMPLGPDRLPAKGFVELPIRPLACCIAISCLFAAALFRCCQRATMGARLRQNGGASHPVLCDTLAVDA